MRAGNGISRRSDTLEHLLRNEADMAYKRRVRVLLEYLDIRDRDMVLDAGCGLGFHLFLLSELYKCRLVGLDASTERLAKARRELKGRDVLLCAASIYRLPFPDDYFDKIILSEVLEHLEDDLRALIEVQRVLRPGGTVAITVPNRNYPFWWDPVNKTLEFFARPPVRRGLFGGIWTDHVRLYDAQELRALAQRADLAVDDVRAFTHYCFPFSHNIVYGIGKPLVESGLLAQADRFRGQENSGSWLNPINLGLRLFNRIDKLNDKADHKSSFVSITLKARKRMYANT